MAARLDDGRRPEAPLADLRPSSFGRGRPGPVDEDDADATVWFKEPGEPPLWHIATERFAYGWYRTECDWEIRLRYAAAIWPAKRGEIGPSEPRCRSCVEMHAVTARLARRLGRAVGPHAARPPQGLGIGAQTR